VIGEQPARMRFIINLRESARRAVPLGQNSGRLKAPIAKVLRFSGVGVASGALYALGATASLHVWDLDGRLAVVVGYAVSLPFNFLAHRHHTFRSRGIFSTDLVRYILIQFLNFGACLVAMMIATEFLALPYAVGIVGGVVLSPLITFLALNFFVFRNQSDPTLATPVAQDREL
jgi:putative flippase GtrA